MTDKQKVVFDALMELNEEGVQPTVRSLTDRLETRKIGSQRFSDDEVRGLLERLEEDAYVRQLEPGAKGEARYVTRRELQPGDAPDDN